MEAFGVGFSKQRGPVCFVDGDSYFTLSNNLSFSRSFTSQRGIFKQHIFVLARVKEGENRTAVTNSPALEPITAMPQPIIGKFCTAVDCEINL